METYTITVSFLDFQTGPLKFTERQFLTELYCHCVTGDDEWPRIDAVSEGLRDDHDLRASLSKLSEMGIIKFEEDLITQGAHFTTGNDAWLEHYFLKELTEMEAAERVAAPVELSQCDSCKRRLCDSHDELHTFSLHAVESGTIRRKGRFKFPHIKSSSGQHSRT